MNYRVVWKRKGTNQEFKGEPMSYEEAKASADQMNKKHPDLYHWVEEAPEDAQDYPDAESQTPPTLSMT